MSNKITELAKKLNELAKRGIGGEKDTAQKMLHELMSKHSITFSDIDDEVLTKHIFIVRQEQKNIFWQIISSVLGKDFRVWGDRKNKKKIYLETTAADAIEIHAKFDFYWKLWLKEVDALKYAFYSKHNIFPANDDGISVDDMSEEQLERLKKSEKLKHGLSDESFYKRLTVK